MALEQRFTRALRAKANNEKHQAREAEIAGQELAQFAKFLALNDLPLSASDTGSRATEHMADAEKHLAQLERMISLLNDPERVKRIVGIARRELGRNQK